MRTINLVVVHETATPVGWVPSIRANHMKPKSQGGRGWTDIGYHYLILNGRRTSRSGFEPSLDGHISLGRPVEKSGAHAEGYNRNSIGVACVGDGAAWGCIIIPGRQPATAWTPTGGYMTQHQWQALLHVCLTLMARYNLSPAQFKGHRELPNVKKSCPGFEGATLRRALSTLR